MTRNLLKFDWLVAWVNMLFLFAIALTPFAAALLGEYGSEGLSWQIYCLALIAAGVGGVLLFLSVSRDGGRLVGGMTRREYWYRFIRACSPGVAFAIALAASLMGWPTVSNFCWLLIPVILVGARWVTRPEKGEAGWWWWGKVGRPRKSPIMALQTASSSWRWRSL